MVAKHNLDIRRLLSMVDEELLYDPQTSGGLLLSVPNDQAGDLVSALHEAHVTSAVCIGEVVAGSAGIAIE